MLNALLIIAGTAPAIIIAIAAHNRAVAAEASARQAAEAAAQPVTHTVEIRHVRFQSLFNQGDVTDQANDSSTELPPLPEFMQPRRLSLPEFINQPKGEPPHAN